jgi:hypothetical protein
MWHTWVKKSKARASKNMQGGTLGARDGTRNNSNGRSSQRSGAPRTERNGRNKGNIGNSAAEAHKKELQVLRLQHKLDLQAARHKQQTIQGVSWASAASGQVAPPMPASQPPPTRPPPLATSIEALLRQMQAQQQQQMQMQQQQLQQLALLFAEKKV